MDRKTSFLHDESPENIASHASRLYMNRLHDEAKVAYERALLLDPTNEEALVGVARVAAVQNDHSGAYELYKNAEKVVTKLKLRQEIQTWLGVTSRRFGRLDESFRHLSAAVRLTPGNREMRYHLAMTSATMLKLDVALHHMRHIKAFIDPDFLLLKSLLAGLDEWSILTLALDLCWVSACSFTTDFTREELMCWLAEGRKNLGQIDESERLLNLAIAESSHEKVREYLSKFQKETARNRSIMKTNESVEKELLLLRDVFESTAPSVMQQVKRALERCDWDLVDAPALAAALRNDLGIVNPFTCITLPPLNADDCLEVSRTFARKQLLEARKLKPSLPAPNFECDREGDFDLIVGVYSSDFRPHPMAPVLKAFFAHAKVSGLDVIFFHKDAAPSYLERTVPLVRELVDVSDKTARDIAIAARERGVQVWLETSGYTGSSSNAHHLFHSPAPVVVSWAGFPGSMGARDFVHYIVADDYSIPSSAVDKYDEKPIRVPGSWLIVDPGDYAVAEQFRAVRNSVRADLLNVTDPSMVIYGYLGRMFKISRDDMDRWCRIAEQVHSSVFLMVLINTKEEASLAADNIRKHWTERCKLDADRLIFTQPFHKGEHLKAWVACDVALGTSTYNSGATAVDALFSGVPLVHLAGGMKMMQRAEGSVLKALGMDELIADSSFEYVQIATRLGANKTYWKHISSMLTHSGSKSIFSSSNTSKSVSAMSRGMKSAYQRYCKGEMPSEISFETLRVTEAASNARFVNPSSSGQFILVGFLGFISGLLLASACFRGSRERPAVLAQVEVLKKKKKA